MYLNIIKALCYQSIPNIIPNFEKLKDFPLRSRRAIIHIYMEVPQGNPLCSYLKQAKMSFSSSFFFLRQNWRTGGWV
jgi:hypothetical protein